MGRKQDAGWEKAREAMFDAWAAKNDREIAMRRVLVSVSDELERATKSDDDERSLLFHLTKIRNLCASAVTFNEAAAKCDRNR